MPGAKKCEYEGCSQPAEFDLEGQTRHGRFFCYRHAQSVHNCRERYFRKLDGGAVPALCGNCDAEDD